MSDMLQVVVRKTRGTRAAQRERAAGLVPAILYGHQKENVALSIPAAQLEAAIRHGSRVVELRGEITDNALISDVQWDTFGASVVHLDLTRVVAGERVKTTITIELRGEAPGVKEGGRLNMVTHELDVECPVSLITDRIQLNVNALELNQAIHANEVPIPAGMTLLSPGDSVVVQCLTVEEEPEETPALAGEPEIIGRKAEDEGSED